MIIYGKYRYKDGALFDRKKGVIMLLDEEHDYVVRERLNRNLFQKKIIFQYLLNAQLSLFQDTL